MFDNIDATALNLSYVLKKGKKETGKNKKNYVYMGIPAKAQTIAAAKSKKTKILLTTSQFVP